MFPAPSPGTSAMFNSMSNSGLATPGTIDFHRTAINAAARSKVDNNNNNNMQTQPQSQAPIAPKQEYPQQGQPSGLNSDPFNNHPDRDAVNSLYMLAQTGNRNANQFAVPPPPMRSGMQSQDTSPTTARGRTSNVGTDGSHSGDDDKGSGKGRKKSSIGKGPTTTNARRKAEDLLPKQPGAKRMKGGNNMGMMPPDMDDDDMFDEDDIKGEMSDIGPNGKKMTDEEKRKNFLERNRYV
jgi:ATF/CREB family transcription factor